MEALGAHFGTATGAILRTGRQAIAAFSSIVYNADTVCAALALRAPVAIRAFRLFADFGIADLSLRAVCVFHAVGLGVSDAVAAVAGFAITAWMLIIAFEPAAATQMTKLIDFAALA